MSPDRFKYLAAFLQTASRGSFTAAADALELTPAAVSKNVAALEQALNVRLFNRTTRSLNLTDEGRMFFAQAQVAFQMLEEAAGQIAYTPDHIGGTVRVSVSYPIGQHLVMPHLGALLNRYPDLDVQLIYNDRLLDLVKENFDLAIRGMISEDSAVIVRPVGKLQTCLVAAPDYLAAHGVPQQESDLAAHQLLSSQSATGKPRTWLLQQHDGSAKAYQPSRSRLTTSSPDSLAQAALQGLGIAQLPVYLIWQNLLDGSLKTVLNDIHLPQPFELSIQYPHRTMLASRVRVVLDFLLETMKNHAGLQASRADLLPFAAPLR